MVFIAAYCLGWEGCCKVSGLMVYTRALEGEAEGELPILIILNEGL